MRYFFGRTTWGQYVTILSLLQESCTYFGHHVEAASTSLAKCHSDAASERATFFAKFAQRVQKVETLLVCGDELGD